jgi:anti-anti-sigma regulatory factor
MQFHLVSDDQQIVRINVEGDLTPERPEDAPLGSTLGEGIYHRKVALNLADSPFANSPGMGWLLINHDRFSKAGGKCVAHSLPPGVMQAIKLLRLDKKLLLADNEAAAVARLMERQT